MRPSGVSVEIDVSDWEFDEPTAALPQPEPLPIPLTRRLTPVPLAEGVRRPEPLLTLKIRDLLVCAPWSITIGVVCARFQVPILGAVLGAAAFGVFFDRVLRRWC